MLGLWWILWEDGTYKKKSVKKVLKVTSLVQHQLHTELI